MVTAVYPFWGAVATQVGRLLRLQESVSAPQIQRRIREQYGERETVFRAARRVLRSFLDWGVLKATGTRGIYTQSVQVEVDQLEVVAWLIEASLRSRRNESASLSDLVENAGLFPFRLKKAGAQRALPNSTGLELLRQGLDEDLVVLRQR